MKIVFIAGPFTGDGSKAAKESNIDLAKKFISDFIDKEIPFYSPHLNINQEAVKFEENKSQYTTATNHTFLERSDVLAVLPGWEESSGTVQEVAMAKEKDMKIFYLEEAGAIDEIKKFVAQ